MFAIKIQSTRKYTACLEVHSLDAILLHSGLFHTVHEFSKKKKKKKTFTKSTMS